MLDSADPRTRKLRERHAAEQKKRQEQEQKEQEGLEKEKTVIFTKKNANLFYVEPDNKYPPPLTDATGCIFPTGVKDAYTKALDAREIKRLPQRDGDYYPKINRPFVFSYFKVFFKLDSA